MSEHIGYSSAGSAPLKIKRDAPEKRDAFHQLIAIVGVGGGVMLAIALIIVSPETGPSAVFKALLIASIAGLVAYSVNFYGITQGAPQAAIGFKFTGFITLLGIWIAGAAMAIGSFTGVVYPSVQQIVLEESGAAIGEYIGDVNQAVVEAGRAGPAVQRIAEDYRRYAECERKFSCLSRVGNGGFGPVAAQMHKGLLRAEGVATAFENGDAERRSLASELARLYKRYQKKLADTSINISERRAILRSIHLEIEQVGAALAETVPISLLISFEEELRRGVSIPGQINANREINSINRQHADSLEQILASLDQETIKTPVFPIRPGMMSSLKYIADFAAFAAVILLAELVLPTVLWVVTYTKLVWEIERRTENDPPTKQQNGFGDLIDLPPLVTERYEPDAVNDGGKRRAKIVAKNGGQK